MAANESYFNSQSSTQEVKQLDSSQTLDAVCEAWGCLFSLKDNLPTYNLNNFSHSFGRGYGLADHCFNKEHFDSMTLSVLSKVHFKITREESEGEYVVIVEDCSFNGTFINESKLGKNSKKVLRNNDTISVAQPKLKLFVYYDRENNDSKEFPSVLTSRYTMTRKLGDGSYGEVRLAYKHGTLERVAVKIITKKIFNSSGTSVKFNNITQIENEVRLLTSINHPNIIRLLDMVESEEKIFIIMELADGGELFDKIRSHKNLKEPLAKLYFFQLVQALVYLHRMNITHRDIKPENILLNSEQDNTIVKLTDFGLSRLTENVSEMSTFCGTQQYIAPELLNLKVVTYTNKVDMWSLGVVLFVSLAGQLPFYGNNDLDVRRNILVGKYSMANRIWRTVSDEAKDLVKKLLSVDPKLRPSAKEALEHPWFQDDDMESVFDSLLSEMNSPNKRKLQEEDSTLPDKTPKLMSGVQLTL